VSAGEAAPLADAGAAQTIWVNGQAAQTVSPLERGLHYGDGLFETIACVGGEPRFLGLHLERLAAGCARLHLPPQAAAPVGEEVRRLAHGTARAVIKVLVTRGAAIARGYGATGEERATRICLRYGWPEPDAALEREGVRVRLAAQRLGENAALAGIKHCNRLEQVLARAEWRDPDIAEALMQSSGGALICGTSSNLFIVRAGRLCTARLDRCGVAGVMRRVVLSLAAHGGIATEERVLDLRDVESAPEIFLTNALIGIRPVREFAGRALQAGPLTRALQAQLSPWLQRARELPPGSAGG
jgi:4-amino-4-deoxychorismate lyase